MNKPINYNLVQTLKEKDEIFDVISTLDYPTIADVVVWLYEKYEVWIFSYLLGMKYFCYKIQKVQTKDTNLPFIELVKDSITSDEIFDTLDESYEKAIEYCLNNLI